jgi:hypothetical protein
VKRLMRIIMWPHRSLTDTEREEWRKARLRDKILVGLALAAGTTTICIVAYIKGYW